MNTVFSRTGTTFNRVLVGAASALSVRRVGSAILFVLSWVLLGIAVSAGAQ